MSTPHRPALRWHGGKWLLAPWIIAHLPPHRLYTECYGGAASVLMRKPRAYAEIYNDLDAEVVNLFRVCRSPRADELRDSLRLTPFARAEFVGAYENTTDDVERARRLIVRSFMGFGSDGHNKEVRTGFRANSNRSGTTPARDWTNYPDALLAIIERFRGVTVEQRPALDVMLHHDGPEALHYVDPPYLPATRSTKSRKGGGRYHAYTHEMTLEQHHEMLEVLPTLAGMVLLSGYPSAVYEAALRGWERVERASLADGARPRTEVLWLNQSAARALSDSRSQRGLFAAEIVA